LYEAKRADTLCRLTLGILAKSVYLCDMLENTQKELPIQEEAVSLHFRTFEVITLRIKQ
ncbi:MAG: hypothetical protein IJ719_13785, partial [Clostridia bacterium]|nr:hypothetical protein [Clostridia bacterium]